MGIRGNERKREKERRKRERILIERRKRERTRRGVDIVATDVTATTVPKPGETSSRPTFEKKKGEGMREK